MLKHRMEALTDAMFPIIMTLLVIEIRVPEHVKNMTEQGLWKEIVHTWPLFFSFIMSFCLLVNLWFGHTFLFSMLAKGFNRNIGYINALFMGVICLIPYTSHLLGSYPESQVAVTIYSAHVLVIYALFYIIRSYIRKTDQIESATFEELGYTKLDYWYGSMRVGLNIVFSLIAILVSFYSTYLSIGLIVFTLVINTIPGLTGAFLRFSGLQKLLFK
jgi:uncharacterized membrane protein